MMCVAFDSHSNKKLRTLTLALRKNVYASGNKVFVLCPAYFEQKRVNMPKSSEFEVPYVNLR